jgi:formylglycine-generating enzyme required for sulfatase activity
MRGGSWAYSADFSRCAYRFLLEPGSRETYTDVGFRVLMEAEATEE